MMKYLCCISIICLPCFIFAQAEKDTLNILLKNYKEIETWKASEKVSPKIEIYKQCLDDLDEDYEDTATSTTKYYYKGKKLQCITYENEPDINTYIHTEYYFVNDALFFAIQTSEQRYSIYKPDSVINIIEVYKKSSYFLKGTAYKCFIKAYSVSATGEGNWPDKTPFNELGNLSNKEVICDTTMTDILTTEYFLSLLKLGPKELKENCLELKIIK